MNAPIEPDLKLYEKLCKIHATDHEMADFFDCSAKTIQRLRQKEPYGTIYRKARADGKLSIRRKQFEKALKGSDAMLKWLGITVLGQKETINNVLMTPDEAPMPEEDRAILKRFVEKQNGRDQRAGGTTEPSTE